MPTRHEQLGDPATQQQEGGGVMAPPSPALLALGRAVRRVREERGLSVAAVATAAGVDRADVAAIEAGGLDPGYWGLRRLAAALGVTGTALLVYVERYENDLDPRAVSIAFGSRLRELRARYGVSQDDLARETGVHPTAIGRFERGAREPRLTSILCLAYGLGVEPGELVNALRAEQPDDATPGGEEA
jgi:transcriptional regulator with XRE-family HTH domain